MKLSDENYGVQNMNKFDSLFCNQSISFEKEIYSYQSIVTGRLRRAIKSRIRINESVLNFLVSIPHALLHRYQLVDSNNPSFTSSPGILFVLLVMCSSPTNSCN